MKLPHTRGRPAHLVFAAGLCALVAVAAIYKGGVHPRHFGWVVTGLAILGMLFVFFGKLRRIIGTVGEGDPFQPENATRLSQMGWLMLGTQLAIIPAGFIAIQLTRYADAIEKTGVENFHFSMGNGDLDMTALLLVVILFILARVFRHGAAMREDLEGTV